MAMQATQMSVREQLERAFANKWLFLLCALGGLVVSYWVAENKEVEFEATAEILVEAPMQVDPLTQDIGAEMTEGVVGAGDLTYRFNKARARALSEENLVQIARSLDLSDFNPEDPAATALGVEDSLDVSLRGGKIFVKCSRRTAQGAIEARDIANRVAQLMVAEQANVRETQINEAMGFYKDLTKKYAQKLHEAELSLQNFEELYAREKNQADPQTKRRGYERIQLENATTDELAQFYKDTIQKQTESAMALTALEAKKAEVERQIGQEAQFEVTEITEVPSEAYKSLERQRSEVLAELTELSKSRRETHPQIAEKKAALEQIDQAMQGVEKNVVEKTQRAANPVLAKLQLEVSTLNSDIAAQTSGLKMVEEDLAYLDERIRKMPPREAQRQRQILETQHELQYNVFNDLNTRYAKAELAGDLARSERALRFTLLRPAEAPEKPVRPNKNFILAMGLFIGMALGVVVCFVREFTDTSFRSIDDASRFLDLPVLGVIPEVAGAPRRRRTSEATRGQRPARLTQ